MERNGTTLSFRNVYINIGGRSLMLVSTPANAKRCLFEIELDRTLSIGKFYHHSKTESYITTFNTLQATAIRTNMNTKNVFFCIIKQVQIVSFFVSCIKNTICVCDFTCKSGFTAFFYICIKIISRNVE